MRIFDAVMFQTELPNVHAYVLVADELLFEDVLQEHEHDSHHALFVHFIFVALAAALVHAVLHEQVCEFFWEFYISAKTVEYFKQAGR